MDENIPQCVVCKQAGDKVLLFNEKSLKKFKEVKVIRAQYKLKHHDVILPPTVTSEHGYHHTCYRLFTALKSKYYKYEKKSLLPIEKPPQPSTSCSAAPVGNEGLADESTTEPALPTTPKRSETHCFDQFQSEVTPVKNSDKELVNKATQTPTKNTALQLQCFDKSSQTVGETGVSEVPCETPTPCIFCNQVRKRVRGHLCTLLKVKGKSSFLENVKLQATKLQDEDLLSKVQKVGKDQYLTYHNKCRANYYNRFRSLEDMEKEQGHWHMTRTYHKMAFEELSQFIEQHVLENRKCCLLSVLSKSYTMTLARIKEENDFVGEDTDFKPHHLKDKIQKTFKEQIYFSVIQHTTVLAPSDVLVDENTLQSLRERSPLQEAAMMLRQSIYEMEKKPIPVNSTTQQLIDGECTIPQELIEFLSALIGGLNFKHQQQEKCARRVASIAQDMIFSVRHGRVKPSKHVVLGLVLKSLTSSRKVIDILNRYGHCCSYSTLEELETETTIASTSRASICPSGISREAELNTGVAFDNFDRYVETLSGKDTLHDTVGIIYQNCRDPLINQENFFEVEEEIESEQQDTVCRRRKRRSFEAITPHILPYPKKPKMIEPLLEINHEKRQSLPVNLKIGTDIDMLWVLSHALGIPQTPMWVGFNSRIYDDSSVKQLVTYLTPINLSPTETAVVVETLEQALQIADECHQKYIQVTYDLAIAKVALQVQSIEKPRFNNIFIHLGAFHVMMAYFKAVGKFIDGSGLTYIMEESDLIASGSVNGLISGKHFNRCKRLHPLVALGIQILHFKAFTRDEDIRIDEDVIDELKSIKKKTVKASISPLNDNGSLADLIRKYSTYKEKTLRGEHGKTPQFFMMYAGFINNYLTLSRSIRTSDFDLFKYVLPKLSNLFFVFNQPNYARWLVKYHDMLLNVEQTHPGLEVVLQSGTFGVKRTEKPFSRQPVDLTLEQTVNADAAKRLTGVAHFTNSISARQRWSRAHSIKSTLISHVYNQTGLLRTQDVTADLEPHNLVKHNAALQNFLHCLENTMNPFDSNLDKDLLYNIGTGRAAPEEISDFLLNVEAQGQHLRESFINECFEDPSRFEKPIKRTSIQNFASVGIKKRVKIGSKTQEVKMQRDLFGRMLAVSINENIDVAKILSFPLTPVPLSMSHLDGTMCKTDKSSLMKLLEKKIASEPPKSVDIVLVDGVFMLHLLKEVPKTFGNISKKFLQLVTRTSASRVDVIFDEYQTPSIKDYERRRRRNDKDYPYNISSADQVRPADFGKELNNDNFKYALINFFISHWATQDVLPFLTGKTIYLSFDKCYRYWVKNGVVHSDIDLQLSCGSHNVNGHEEADTKIIYHISQVNSSASVSIRCSDTDILIIMLGNMSSVSDSVHIWMDVGVGNNQRYLDVTKLYQHLGPKLSASLPGFHAFTGCDYNPAFFKKGKVKPFSLLEKKVEYQEAFIKASNFPFPLSVRDEVFAILEMFICHMYGVKDCTSVDEARYETFVRVYKFTSKSEAFLRKFKNIDSSVLPPCKAELEQHLLRTHYISSLWAHAHLQQPSTLDPHDYGWLETDGNYDILWFRGDQSPNLVSDVIIQPQNDGEDINDTDDEDADDLDHEAQEENDIDFSDED